MIEFIAGMLAGGWVYKKFAVVRNGYDAVVSYISDKYNKRIAERETRKKIEQPHIVRLPDGRFCIRKQRDNEFMYLDLKDGRFWTDKSESSYFKTEQEARNRLTNPTNEVIMD